MLETMPISEKLKMLRDRHGLTLDELAEMCIRDSLTSVGESF